MFFTYVLTPHFYSRYSSAGKDDNKIQNIPELQNACHYGKFSRCFEAIKNPATVYEEIFSYCSAEGCINVAHPICSQKFVGGDQQVVVCLQHAKRAEKDFEWDDCVYQTVWDNASRVILW